MEDRSATGDVFSGVRVYWAWGLSTYRGHQSYSDGIQLLTGALWLWQVQTHTHLQSGPEVSKYSSRTHTHTHTHTHKWNSLTVAAFFFSMNTRQCGNILHFFSGGELQNGITKHSDTFAPPKLLVSAIPSNQSTQKVQKQKFEPCYRSGNWNLSSVTLWTLINVCPFAQWAELSVWVINPNGNVTIVICIIINYFILSYGLIQCIRHLSS